MLIICNLSDTKNYWAEPITSILPKTFKDLISKKISLLFKNILCDSQHDVKITPLIVM